MNNFTFGEVFESDAPRASRPSRSTAQYKMSYNEDLMSPSFEGTMEMHIHPPSLA
jgi:hypothetical protein